MFLLSKTGECDTCNTKISDKEIVKCRCCENKFHAICNQVAEKSQKICNVSFWQSYLTAKQNFSWACDECLTKEETTTASSLKTQIDLLAQSVQSLRTEIQVPHDQNQIEDIVKKQVSDEFAQFKIELTESRATDQRETSNTLMEALRLQMSEELNLLTTAAANTVKDNPLRADTPWGDSSKVDKIKVDLVKSSLMVKPDNQGNPVDVNKIKTLAVNNGIPVNSIKVTTKGETFVNLPSEQIRNKFTPLLQAQESSNEVLNVKSKLPTISLLRVTEALTPNEIKEALYRQNENIKALMDAKSHLSVVFTKPPGENQDYHQIALRVSPEIRKSIKAYGDKVHIRGSFYKVDDRFYIKRCNRCQQFGHYADKCDHESPEVCGYCTEHHKSNECPKRDLHYLEHECVNCKSSELESKGHSTFWRYCPAYIIQQNKLKGSISYNYSN